MHAGSPGLGDELPRVVASRGTRHRLSAARPHDPGARLHGRSFRQHRSLRPRCAPPLPHPLCVPHTPTPRPLPPDPHTDRMAPHAAAALHGPSCRPWPLLPRSRRPTAPCACPPRSRLQSVLARVVFVWAHLPHAVHSILPERRSRAPCTARHPIANRAASAHPVAIAPRCRVNELRYQPRRDESSPEPHATPKPARPS